MLISYSFKDGTIDKIIIEDDECGFITLDYNRINNSINIGTLYAIINYYKSLPTELVVFKWMQASCDRYTFTSISHVYNFLKRHDLKFSDYSEQIEKYMLLL